MKRKKRFLSEASGRSELFKESKIIRRPTRFFFDFGSGRISRTCQKLQPSKIFGFCVFLFSARKNFGGYIRLRRLLRSCLACLRRLSKLWKAVTLLPVVRFSKFFFPRSALGELFPMRWVTKRARDFENARFARVFSSFRSRFRSFRSKIQISVSKHLGNCIGDMLETSTWNAEGGGKPSWSLMIG